MQRRGKVGGILDRRFGENDPTMTPEQKALERFVREKQRGTRKGALFDLEDADGGDQLTHFGQSLSFNKPGRLDDFEEVKVDVSDGSAPGEGEDMRPVKRRRLFKGSTAEGDPFDDSKERQAERPKTKKEVMTEVISKSKLHKYERQQAKEDDDDLRSELDKGLPDLFALLRGAPRPPSSALTKETNGLMNPDRAALLNGKDRPQADKEYDERLRQMVFDQRSKPTERTLTEEEKLHHEAQKLRDLEEKRLKRMKGERDDSEAEVDDENQSLQGEENLNPNEDMFGLGSGIPNQGYTRNLGVEDEDEFVIEDNLVGNGSDLASGNGSDEESAEGSYDGYDDQEFVRGLLSKDDFGRAGLLHASTQKEDSSFMKDNALAYTYPCPQNHEALLAITESISTEDFPTVVQRIRALYHPKLHSENKAKLASFSGVLVDHISYLANLPQRPPFAVLETLIRHIHSLAKTFPEEIGCAFRSHLESLHQKRPTAPTSGDLVLLTAIASIFPTSDHFHQIVTPANLCMTRYLSQKIPITLSDLATGTYLGTLCVQYQRFSKRYIPELINYILQALLMLAPAKMKFIPGSFPYHTPTLPQRIEGRSRPSDRVIRRLGFWDSVDVKGATEDSNEEFKLALVHTLLALVSTMADMWADKLAFCEVFDPLSKILEHLSGKPCAGKLPPATKVINPSFPHAKRTQADNINPQTLLTQTLLTIQNHIKSARLARRPLALHNHRPLAIKTSIPKFEESYNPDRHYDPDSERAASSKLKAEYKKERKGALRELRKDASFMAREGLKQKRERDAEYERKFKRLVAEIQGEEGREAKGYEREKRLRKGKGKR
jgi:nucleolar protein 14